MRFYKPEKKEEVVKEVCPIGERREEQYSKIIQYPAQDHSGKSSIQTQYSDHPEATNVQRTDLAAGRQSAIKSPSSSPPANSTASPPQPSSLVNVLLQATKVMFGIPTLPPSKSIRTSVGAPLPDARQQQLEIEAKSCCFCFDTIIESPVYPWMQLICGHRAHNFCVARSDNNSYMYNQCPYCDVPISIEKRTEALMKLTPHK